MGPGSVNWPKSDVNGIGVFGSSSSSRNKSNGRLKIKTMDVKHTGNLTPTQRPVVNWSGGPTDGMTGTQWTRECLMLLIMWL